MEVAYVQDPSDYVAEAPEVVYHRVVLFYYLLGIAEPINGAYFFRDGLDTRNACSVYKPAFRSSAHCIASQLSAFIGQGSPRL
jgi:hypothetical protein